MFAPHHYELIDFGEGRKLEQFGKFVLDRPCPAANGIRRVVPHAWDTASARFEKSRSGGAWVSHDPNFPPTSMENTDLIESSPANPRSEAASPTGAPWTITHGPIRFLLRPTAFGHVGVFPEQAANWQWIGRQVRRCLERCSDRPPRVLNLFGYTGGSTLAAAAAGAQVTHIDSARNTVAWARHNASASGLGNAPIRWIIEDAATFARREVKRGNQYDGIILDPPSYGHGPKGQKNQAWKITQHLLPLLSHCAQLTRASRQFILLTCHAPELGAAEIEAYLAQAVFGSCSAGAAARRLNILTRSSRKLNAGIVARWPGP